MAKVNTIMYSQIYTSSNNPNMHFHIMVRSYDGIDRKSDDVKDNQFINGSIDGVDVMSDCITTEDYYQSQHIILRDKENRAFNGHDYHMVESLANSCDIATIPDWEVTIVDNKGRERHCKQFYTKAADEKTVYVKSYVEGIFVYDDYFNLIYTPTDYSDENPRSSCLNSHSLNYEEVKKRLRDMVEQGHVAEKLTAPDIVKGTYVTHDIKFYYSGTWNVSLKPSGEDDYVNEITFTLKYGTTEKADVTFSTTPSIFSDENYETAADTLATVVTVEVDKLKTFLDSIAIAKEVQVPPDVTGFYRAGHVVYYYWLHYNSRVKESADNVTTTVTYQLKWGTDDCANKFSNNAKSYDTTNYALASVELVEEGSRVIHELFDYLDNLTGVKLVTGYQECYENNTVNYANGSIRDNTSIGNEIVTVTKQIVEDGKSVNKTYVSHEIGAHPYDPGGKTLVLAAHEFEQGVDSNLTAMLHLDGDILTDRTGSSWTTSGTPIMTEQNATIGKGMLVSDGRYIVSKTVNIGAESFTVDFFAFIDKDCPDNACICDINHPSYDIKIKVIKEYNSTMQRTDVTIGFYVNSELKVQSKTDIKVSELISHYAVVHQKATEKTFFFINGTLIGQQEGAIQQGITKIYFNHEVTTGKSTFIGTLDEIRISTGLARWIPNQDFQEYKTDQVTDAVGALWQMHNGDVQPAPIGKGKFENPDNPGYTTGLYFDNHKDTTKYPSGIKNNKYKNDVIYAELVHPDKDKFGDDVVLGGEDFTIDFWYYFEIYESGMGGTFEINALDPITRKVKGAMGFHLVPTRCIHGTGDLQLGSNIGKIQAKTLHHIAFVYINKTGKLFIYSDGVKQKETSWSKMKTEHILKLNVGKYYEGGGPHGPMWGAIDEFRISKGIARWTANFELPTEPYQIDDYTIALLRTSSFDQQISVTEEEVDNPNYIFNPPKTTYDISHKSSGQPLELISYYIPLNSYFDDDKFNYIDKYPEQINIPMYDGIHTFTPEWKNYDINELQLTGEPSELSSSIAGSHYVTFTPWNDHLWAKSCDASPKIIRWIIRTDMIENYPEQEESLEYNGDEQDVNLVNFVERQMTLSGTVRATNVNSFDEPYICYATPKPGYCWPSGDTEPYEIRWYIVKKEIPLPTLKESSSLNFTYDGNEKAPGFNYDDIYVQKLGTVSAIMPNAKHIDGSIITEDYTIIFALKDRDNTCWLYPYVDDAEHDDGEVNEEDISEDDEFENNEDQIHEDENGNITFLWKIRRKPITIFTVENTTLVYKPEKQGPTITPSTWNTNEVLIIEYWEQPVKKYTMKFHLVDDKKYEWTDGETGDRYVSWEIIKAQAILTLSPDNVVLIPPPDPPTADITITKTGTGALSCSRNDYVQGIIDGNILQLKGKKATAPGTTTELTVVLEDDDNYIGTTAKVTVEVVMGLERYTWQEIADMASNGTLLDHTFIGDTKSVKMRQKLPIITFDEDSGEVTTEYDDSNDYLVSMILIGVDHNPNVEGNKKAHFMLGKMGKNKDILLPNTKNVPIFSTNTNAYGWRIANINLQLITPSSGLCYSDIFPTDFLEVVTPSIKWTDNIGGGKNNAFFVTPTLNWVFLLSEYEVFGTTSYANSEEAKHQDRYQYFINGGRTKRERTDDVPSNGWSLRSVNKNSSSQTTAVNSNGNLVSVPVNSILDIVPVFTVSRKKPDNLRIPAIDQCIECLMHFD